MTDQTGTAPTTQLHAAADRIITTALAPSWLAGPLQAWLRDAAWDADTAVGPNRHAIAVANAILAQPEPAEHTAPTPAAEERRHPPASRRDVSWTVIFRLEGTGIWTEWGKGHRTSSEAVREAEVLAHIPDVAEVRFERVTLQRDRFTLHDLAALNPQQNQPAAAPRPCPPGCIACATDESHDPTPAGTSSTPRPAKDGEERRKRYARAIHRYDNEHGLSGNDLPSQHHYGEAAAVMAVADAEQAELREQAEQHRAAILAALQLAPGIPWDQIPDHVRDVEEFARRGAFIASRVRAECDRIDADRAHLDPECESFGDGLADAVTRIRAIIDNRPKIGETIERAEDRAQRAEQRLRLIDGMRQANLDSAAAAVQRAERAEAALARGLARLDAWEQRLPETVRTATVIDVLRNDLDPQ